LLVLALILLPGTILLAAEPAGDQGNNAANTNSNSNPKLRPDEIRLRIVSNRAQIKKLQADMDELQKIKVSVEPLVLPPEPKYPPKPVKKDTASKLKMGEFEDEQSFAKRVEAAKASDEKEFHFEEVSYGLQVDGIKQEYDANVKTLKEAHAKRLAAEEERVAKAKENLPETRARIEKDIAALKSQIAADERELASMGQASPVTPDARQYPASSPSAPEAQFRIAAYSALPRFHRQSMAFENVRVECRGTRFLVDTSEFDLVFNDITVRVKFDTLKGAEEFKTLSETGKLYCFIVLNKKNLAAESKYASPSWLSVWSETYHTPDGSFLFESDTWARVAQRKRPLTALPGNGNAEPEEQAVPKAAENSSGMEDTADAKDEKAKDTEAAPENDVRIVEASDSTSPIRIYFGDVDQPIQGIRVTVQGQITISRGQEMAVTDPEPMDELDMPSMQSHTQSVSNNINILGANAGERRTLSVGGVLYPFRWCPPGSFRMGAGKNSYDVKLTKGFWILETEVTQEMYRTVTNSNPSNFRSDKLPVEFVTWGNCLDFCEKLSTKAGLVEVQFSIPTEAQWEYACRAGTSSDFSFGNDVNLLCQFGNYCDKSNTDKWNWRDNVNSDGHDKTAPVASYKPNPWGIYDMHGNVWEWCSSRYGTYPREPAIDPEGPTTGTFRIFRGGSWSIEAIYCRSAVRFGFTPDFRRDDIGFRISLVPNVAPEEK
ncbi:MAG: formylglycine-generating enzyme family protein, partial [Thermoguttaceae bacterium]|nr:formylglycine-generating enzyme family protein [Thermoguttaceae bacterium]